MTTVDGPSQHTEHEDLISSEIESFLRDRILTKLDTGRPRFDKPHTEAVVHHLKNILINSPELQLDREVVLIAAYFHDIGYTGLFSAGDAVQLTDVMDRKTQHMELGAAITHELLNDPVFDTLTDTQKERIVHLVSVHDKLDQLTSLDELILMEADTLGGLDCEIVTPTFDQGSNERFMIASRQKRLSIFVTEFGKNEFERLFQHRQEYYRGLSDRVVEP